MPDNLESDFLLSEHLLYWINELSTACTTLWLASHRAMDEDISRLKTTAVSLLSDLGCNGSPLTEDLINEMCRFGASELHAVAAFIGGIASQEVIKVCFVSLVYYWAMHNDDYTITSRFFIRGWTFSKFSWCLYFLFTTANNKTVCSHFWDLYIQWNRSQVSIVGTVKCFKSKLFCIPACNRLSMVVFFEVLYLWFWFLSSFCIRGFGFYLQILCFREGTVHLFAGTASLHCIMEAFYASLQGTHYLGGVRWFESFL